MIASAALAGIHSSADAAAAFVMTTTTSSLVPTNRRASKPAFLQQTSSPRRNAGPPPLHLFFGKEQDQAKTADPDELRKFPKLASPSSSSSDGKKNFESLSLYIQTWSEQTFGQEDGGKKSGLTTPVTLILLPETTKSSQEDKNNVVVAVSGVQLVFKPTKTGNAYTTKNEEKKAQENNNNKGEGSQKKKPKKEGGVEILVEKLEDGQVQVRARRCELDEDTMIKEMSEETILSKLNEAVKAWKKL
jgi:hypothetical protein